tara:strand:- start:56 stop:316 length:261 start_codon:yes stop_codon:yes gene_type:complete
MSKDYDDDYPRQTEEEIAKSIADQNQAYRHRRDFLLSESDWVVTKALEEGNAIPSDWKTYRQALRDLPTHKNFPNLNDEDYPTKPS